MKKFNYLFLMLVCLLWCSTSASAQAKKSKNTKTVATKTDKKTDAKKKDPKADAKKKDAPKPAPFKPRIAYIMNGQANIRKQANTKGEVLIKLAAGSELNVIADAGAPITIEGAKANWYKVTFRKDTTTTEGFVWGGYLSDFEMESARDKGTQFLMRRNNDTAILVQACFNGNLLSSINVRTKGCKGLSARGKAGWDRVHDALIINSNCKDMAYEDLIIWTGKKLYFAGTAESNTNKGADPFHETHWLIEPDKGAKRDAILKEETDRIEWDGSIYRNAQTKMQRFEWNGTDLIEK